MKKIYFIRHAKSSWDDTCIDDFSRPLNKRGKKTLEFMAKRLKSFKIKPDLILSSPAKRARKTAEGIAQIIGFSQSSIVFHDALYDSSYQVYRYLLDSIDDAIESVFIVAHNPTITQTAELLSGAILTNMPTCSIVCIEFDVDHFADISEESGKVLFFDYPKKHKIG